MSEDLGMYMRPHVINLESNETEQPNKKARVALTDEFPNDSLLPEDLEEANKRMSSFDEDGESTDEELDSTSENTTNNWSSEKALGYQTSKNIFFNVEDAFPHAVAFIRGNKLSMRDALLVLFIEWTYKNTKSNDHFKSSDMIRALTALGYELTRHQIMNLTSSPLDQLINLGLVQNYKHKETAKHTRYKLIDNYKNCVSSDIDVNTIIQNFVNIMDSNNNESFLPTALRPLSNEFIKKLSLDSIPKACLAMLMVQYFNRDSNDAVIPLRGLNIHGTLAALNLQQIDKHMGYLYNKRLKSGLQALVQINLVKRNKLDYYLADNFEDVLNTLPNYFCRDCNHDDIKSMFASIKEEMKRLNRVKNVVSTQSTVTHTSTTTVTQTTALAKMGLQFITEPTNVAPEVMPFYFSPQGPQYIPPVQQAASSRLFTRTSGNPSNMRQPSFEKGSKGNTPN